MHSRACPDCPAIRTRTLEVLVERPSGCAFRCSSVAAREPLPLSWSDEFGLALVRRGVVVRQRFDGRGGSVAIDIAGAGSAVPLPSSSDLGAGAYAADDTMLCLCPRSVLARTVDEGASGARDLVRAQAAMLTRVERIAGARARHGGVARIAALLLAIADTLVPGTTLHELPAAIRQRDLALLAALRHESVCRELRALEDAGLVARVDGALRLLDRAGLERA